MPLDSPLVRRAAEFARQAHAGQVRKCARHPPYFVHLESVAVRVAAHGYDDDELLAASYLHDVLEDQPGHAGALRDEFPPMVVTLVELLTERKQDATGRRRPKDARFADYLAALRADSPDVRRALVISCADKLDNLESLIACQNRGDNLFSRLATRPGQHGPQLARLRELYLPVVAPSMLTAFDEAVRSLEDTLARWLPGRAVAIAAEAHLGQLDKGGNPYVYHPLRMALRAETEAERMVALLHDVVEDTSWTLSDLAAEGFSPEVLAAVDCLTKRPCEPYLDYLDRIASDPLAVRVKRLDLTDNVGRLAQLTEPDRSRLAAKYDLAAARLGSSALDGEPAA